MYPDRCFVVGRMLFYTSSAVHQISLIPIPREIQNEKGEFVLKDKMTIGVADKQLLLAANYLVGLLSRAGVSRSSSIRCLPNGEPGVRLTHMTAVVCNGRKLRQSRLQDSGVQTAGYSGRYVVRWFLYPGRHKGCRRICRYPWH